RAYVAFVACLVFAPLAPVPRDHGFHGDFGNVLKEVENVYDVIASPLAGRQRGEREPAVAVDGGCDAVSGERFHVGRPPDCGVPVVVRLDEAGGDVAASRVDHAFVVLRFKVRRDFGDAAGANAHVGPVGGTAAAVDDGAVPDECAIVHVLLPSVFPL